MEANAKKEITRILDSVRDRDHYTVVRDFFELAAISIRNSVDYGQERRGLEKRYSDIVSGYAPEQVNGFAAALGILCAEIKKAVDGDAAFSDWAGEIYMDSGTSNSKAGQFFTPYSVSRCMAEVNFPEEEVLPKLEGDPDRVITIYEPTCGAGGLVVACIDVLHRMGVNYSWNTFVDCGDIDARCVHMTYATLSLLGVPAVVRLGDALKMEYSQAWFTPAYLFAWPHFKNRIYKGGYPYRATVREPVAEAVTVTEAAPVPVPDKNGQYSLFLQA